MKFNQMKFQKAVVICAFICAILTFAYAYSFSTPFYPLTIGDEVKDNLSWFYYEIQPFNRTLAKLSIAFICVSLLLFLSFSQKRRRYYIFNYISIGAYSLAGLGYSIFSFINLASFSGKYNSLNFDLVRETLQSQLERYEMLEQAGAVSHDMVEAVQAKIDDFNANFSTSTIMFALGYILFAAIIIVSALLIFNCIYKAIKIKKEDEAFAEEDKRIYAEQEAHRKALLADINDESDGSDFSGETKLGDSSAVNENNGKEAENS